MLRQIFVTGTLLFEMLGGGNASANDVYQDIYNSLDRIKLIQLLKDMTGSNSVAIGGETFSIRDRYLPASKANFRKYFTAYFKSLGMQVNELPYTTKYYLEAQGHNVEAVLPGLSKDSIVVIVHYDSIGPKGPDNPGVDDDMTGMASMLETARLLNSYPGRLQHTVRFVAADYEEWGDLEGAKNYLQYLNEVAAKEDFKIIAAIDNEQSGWKEGIDQIDFFTACDGSSALAVYGNLFADTVQLYSQMTQSQRCMGPNSDFYVFSEAGIPAVVFSEHDPFNNPHFDRQGGDTFDRIDQNYFVSIAKVGAAYTAKIIGIQ